MNEIDDYLRANRDAYTREALTKRLVESGHAPDDVDMAWVRIEALDAKTPPGPALPRGRPGLGTIILIIAVVIGYGYIGLIGTFGIGFVAYYGNYAPDGSATTVVNPVATVLLVVYVAAMLVGLGVSIRRLWRAPSLGRGAGAIGTAFGVAVLVLIGINGACIAGVVATSALGGMQ
jgi:hypothetical protein